ncbi:MAG: hypothetical protein IJ583_10285 [Firmicutes bacterium]|nr:hypothetical protein [Bacillota bacterium]
MKYKRIISLIMTFVMLISVSANAEEISAVLRVNTAENTTVGDNFTVKVELSESIIAGGEFTLKYDKDIVEVVSGEASEEFKAKGISYQINKDYDENLCYFTFFNAENVRFEGAFAEFTFKALKEGEAEFTINNVSISDYDLNELKIDVKSGKIKIGGNESSSESTSESSSESTSESSSESTSENGSEISGGFIYGDVNCDGTVNVKDAVTVMKKVLDVTFIMPIENKTKDWLQYADMSGDKILGADDAALIFKKSYDENEKIRQ